MSTDYYLNCKTHNEAVWITDNKANHFPQYDEYIKNFLAFHDNDSCNVVLENDQIIEHDNLKKFKKFCEQHLKDVTIKLNDNTKQKGFKDEEEFCLLIGEADLTTPDKFTAFNNWQENDGTKEGLLKLK